MNRQKFTSKFIKSHGGRELYYPATLVKDYIGDCAFRALAIATETDYLETFKELFRIGLEKGDLPNSYPVVEEFLLSKGFVKHKPFRDAKGRLYQINKVPIDINKSYVFRGSRHLTAIVKGEHLDTWNCGESAANSYYTKK